jgi:hypothetical protein
MTSLSRADVDDDDTRGDGKTAATFSLDQIYSQLMKPIKEVSTVLGPRLKCYVILADKSCWLPREKYETRAKRRINHDKYEPETKIGKNGLILPSSSSTAECGVQIHRLMYSGDKLREQFFKSQIERMKTDPSLTGCRIICDMTTEAPFALFNGKVESLPKCATQIGEDDVSMFEWALSLTDKAQLVLQSVDRDMLLLALLHADKFKNKVFLDFTDQKYQRYVDVQEMAKALVAAGWTVDAFVQTAMLAGTDFVEKKLISNMIGVYDMFAATKALLDRTKFTDLLFCDPRALTVWLRLLYSVKFGIKDELASVARLDMKAKDVLQFPDKSQINKAKKQLTFNYHYWRSLQGRLYCVAS